jgi:hypothetical protein
MKSVDAVIYCGLFLLLSTPLLSTEINEPLLSSWPLETPFDTLESDL